MIQLVFGYVVSLQGFDNGRSDETMQFFVIRHRTPERLERLDHGCDDAAVRLGQRAVEIEKNYISRMLCH